VPTRYRERGDAGAGLDDRRYELTSLLDLAARDEAGGLGDAPWPPHFAKQRGEARRVAPSRARRERESTPDGDAHDLPDGDGPHGPS
jgi:bifunctional non-homologous end joining protein LigD